MMKGLIGGDMLAEFEKRMKLISNELCPRMDALIVEQKKTNEQLTEVIKLLNCILKEMK